MDLKLKYNTFRDKPSESLSQTYTQYKTFLNELSNDGVILSKHEINVGFVNSLPEKWLSFSQGLRNANHTQTLDLADIYGRIFQENSDDEVNERTSDEYLRDLDIESNERARLARMSRDVITVDSKIRIPMYRGEYSQWLERFMNYLEEQTDSASMICSLTHGEQPLHVVTQVPIAGTAPNAPPVHKDPKLWTAEEKWIRMIDHALEMKMRGSEYGEQDRKAVILYKYETFKATEGEQLLDTYFCYIQVINDLKKCGYKKDNCELNYKFLNNLQPEWKRYGTLMRQTKNLMDINIDSLYNILKQNQGDVNDAMGIKKKAVVVTSEPLTLVAEKTKDQVWMESSSDSDQELSENMVFMTKMEKIRSNSEGSSSSAEETIAEISYYSSDSESESESETSDYYDNSTNCGLFVYNDDYQETFNDVIEYASENFDENHIVSQKDHDDSEVDHNDSEEKDHLVNRMIVNIFEEKSSGFDALNKNVERKKNDDLLAQTEILQEQLKVKGAMIDTHTECQAQLHASYDLNDLFVFKDVSIRNSRFSKMPFRKKPRDYLNVRSENNSNNFLPRTLFRWFPKMHPLAEPVAKWIPKICLWILDSGCSKHMTGNRALLTNFVEKCLGMVRFGNDDFAVIAGYGDVVIESMTVKKVYYVEDVIYSMIMMMLASSRRNRILECFLDIQKNLLHSEFTISITKSPTMNVETSNKEIPPSEEEVFRKISESFQEESSSSLWKL
ncbi:hypothetical protein Tco_0860481 [Tanacetum coccineum]|uniref:Retrovirus-related Pol polyprotein from transposon TNT 1-94-like beta-barrel domain-containing protein n=1 Tax=Tanacetum coccineum TaxID=301880 RepID=A0ABQ5BJ34_9ASTR